MTSHKSVIQGCVHTFLWAHTLTTPAAQADAVGVVKALASSVGTASQQKKAQQAVDRAFKKQRLTRSRGIQTLGHHVVEGLDEKISTSMTG